MAETVKTVRVQPWGKGQGDFVEVNESDYAANPDRYKLFTPKTPSAPPPPAKSNKKADKIVNFASDEAAELAVGAGLTPEQIETIAGTGKGGAITVEDIEKFVDNLDV